MTLTEYITSEFGIVPDEVQLHWIREYSQEKSELQKGIENLSVPYVREEMEQQELRMGKLNVPFNCFFEQRVNWVLTQLENTETLNKIVEDNKEAIDKNWTDLQHMGFSLVKI